MNNVSTEVRKIMMRIKGFLYNNVPESSIAILAILIAIIFHGNIIAIVLFLSVGILFFINLLRNIIGNGSWFYFKCSKSYVFRKCMWINQRVKWNRDKTECPQKKFVVEMLKIIDSIPRGTKCYCYTHEIIKDHIIKSKKIHNVEYVYSYSKNIKRLKKQLRNECCKKCLSINCNLLTNEKTQFYAVSFIKKTI
jgi:hypothetical protein